MIEYILAMSWATLFLGVLFAMFGSFTLLIIGGACVVGLHAVILILDKVRNRKEIL
jgi:hypothetical protein